MLNVRKILLQNILGYIFVIIIIISKKKKERERSRQRMDKKYFILLVHYGNRLAHTGIFVNNTNKYIIIEMVLDSAYSKKKKSSKIALVTSYIFLQKKKRRTTKNVYNVKL